jgi:hypothetical protein
MGLDQYAYARTKTAEVEVATIDVAYWRKHPNLQGWMEELWKRKLLVKGGSPEDHTFNGIEVELLEEDINELETAILESALPETDGFFFGQDADDVYREQDLEFIKNARTNLFLGLRVLYNSSW